MNRRCQQLVRSSRRWLIAAAYCLAVEVLFPAMAWAQRGMPEKEEEEKNWGIPYLLVLIMIGAGIMMVCRPSGRKDDVDKRQVDKK